MRCFFQSAVAAKPPEKIAEIAATPHGRSLQIRRPKDNGRPGDLKKLSNTDPVNANNVYLTGVGSYTCALTQEKT
jgi:hypothetical protein